MPLKQLILSMINFDMFNSSSFTEGKFKRKVLQQPNLKAYDFRLMLCLSIICILNFCIPICLYSFLANLPDC